MSRRKGSPRHHYTAAEIRFLTAKVSGRPYAELTELFNRRFGLNLNVGRIKDTLGRHGLNNGRDCRFRPGQTSHNKGKTGVYFTGSEKGWFKPGNKPWTHKPVGAERVNGDGYIDVRIRNPTGKPWKNWKAKHRIIWEKAHGKIPRGHAVIFADGDKRNFALENLLLVSRAELAVMNSSHLISAHRGLTETGKLVADIKLLAARRARGTKSKKRGRPRKTW
jgi:hypothetical protein